MNDKNVVAEFTIIRPSTALAFTPPELQGPEFKDFVKKYYVDTGKILSRQYSLTEDGLSVTYTTVWKNDEFRKEYSDNFFIKTVMDTATRYRKENNIVTRWRNREYDGDTLVREWEGDL